MTDEQVVVADDWTRNWQAKIAVKITAMFLWVIIFSCFVTIVIMLKGLEGDIEMSLQHEADGLTYRLAEEIAAYPSESLAQLVPRLSMEVQASPFNGADIVLAGESVSLGAPHPFAEALERHFSYLSRHNGTAGGTATLTVYHLPVKELVVAQRDRILIWMVVGLLALGLLLTWTIHNVLDKPFRVLTDSAQAVTAGNLNLRVDVSRQDEFGRLARFFNQMLDRIQQQQQELSLANEELRKEITVRTDAEEELRAHRDHLEKLVLERTKDLALMRDEALKASQTKSAFIANISHEIRTPLTPIIGYAESMLGNDIDEEERCLLLNSIVRNGRHLLNVINEILDLSKIEANKLDVEKVVVNPFQLLHDVESFAGMLAREKGLEFELEILSPLPERIHTDPTRLKQILLNLCTNAVKFTDKGSVRVQADCDVEAQKLIINVVDTGIGISQEVSARLFQPFTQADATTTRKYGGTGLGLYISARLADLLGGNIKLASLEALGSRFTLTIDTGPLAGVALVKTPLAADQLLDHSIDEQQANLAGHVLLAEDSLDNQRLVAMYLRQSGVELVTVENGKQAVEAALEGDFDLILMDMQMPVMGGMEAVKLLRRTGYRDPIVALTANAMKEDQFRYKQAGCDDFLSKPMDRRSFYAVLAKYLGGDCRAEDATDDSQDSEFQALVGEFLAGLPEYIDQLHASQAQQDWQALQRVAHTLKGLGGGFGFPGITESAGQLESLLKAGDCDAGATQATLLEAELCELYRCRLPVPETNIGKTCDTGQHS